MVLGFFEMPDEDRPSESIWLNDQALESHFAQLADKRSGGSEGRESVPQVDLAQNELTANIRRGRG